MRTILSIVLLICIAVPAEPLSNFITRRNDTLFNGNSPYRFISFNIPNLHLLEDNFTFDDTNNWALPTLFEIHDAFRSVNQAGGTVIRQYCLRIQKQKTPLEGPKHLTAHRTYNENALLVMDTILSLANFYGIRIIIPFIEGPPWWGSKKAFAQLNAASARFESRGVRDDYKHLVATLCLRRNTVTGISYKDDPAILCWETGNEMSSSASWLHEMAAYIKEIDPNHLLMDGNYGVRSCALDDPNIDIVSNHFYKTPPWMIEHDLKKTGHRKAYLVGEWGWTLERTREILQRTLSTSTSGALIWSLRTHYRSGGFTWHKGEGLHWPGGFYRSELADEAAILREVRSAAFTIRGLPEAPFGAPATPQLLPITTPPQLSWQGSAGAVFYSIDRAPPHEDTWTCIADSVDETVTAYRPLFCDTTVSIGNSYRYRIRAHGPGGTSEPSAVSEVVAITHKTVVDELLPKMQLYHIAERVLAVNDKPWRYKYDFHRVKGKAGASIEYRISGYVTAIRLYTFYPEKIQPFFIEGAKDSSSFTNIPLTIHTYRYCCANVKDHLRLPVLYSADSLPDTYTRLRILFSGDKGEIGRCEIDYK